MKAEVETRRLVSSHWGAYEVVEDVRGGEASALVALPEDPDPSPIGLAMLAALRGPNRVTRPAIRAGWLAERERAARGGSAPGMVDSRAAGAAAAAGAFGEPAAQRPGRGRGSEAFVEVPWDEALDLVAGELQRVRRDHGNASIFGGSYGWSSAGRFHHAQSQVHRFLNSIGGYVRHADSYSLGAARVLMPHVVAPMDELMASHHGWDVLAAHTRLFVSFGGVPAKNSQISAGGASSHHLKGGLAKMAGAGCRFVNFSPVRSDLDVPGAEAEWIPIRPNTDTAVMLALACETIKAGRHDAAFLATHCVGFERWRDYLLGAVDGVEKSAEWASTLSGVPAARIRALASEMASCRSLVNVAWSLQRSDHGEQPYWAAVGLAAVLGQIGLPGGGFGVAYGAVNLVGSPQRRFAGPTLPQGRNPVEAFIPVARIADMLLNPGATFTYNGGTHRYPDIRLVYWAGGNPFHHHQDLNRFAGAWQRPETIIVHEQVWTASAKLADIVLPATTALERDDIGFTTRDALMIAMKPVSRPPGEARDDYDIFCALAQRLDAAGVYAEGLDSRQWLERLYAESVPKAAAAGIELPAFDAFWEAGSVRMPAPDTPVVMLEAFRANPGAAPLKTPSGRIELFSTRIDGFALADCAGHPAWYEPVEWLGATAEAHSDGARHDDANDAAASASESLHLISDQPVTRLHSQLDFSAHSRGAKIREREPVWINPRDAAARDIRDGDIVRLFNARGQCLAGAVVTDAMAPRVLRLSTGAWWDPLEPGVPGSLDKHGNPNVLTRDAPASGLSQGCAAQSCLVNVERYDAEPPPVTAFDLPHFAERDRRA